MNWGALGDPALQTHRGHSGITGVFRRPARANVRALVVDSAYELQKIQSEETQIPESPSNRESQERGGKAAEHKGKIKEAPEAAKKPKN